MSEALTAGREGRSRSLNRSLRGLALVVTLATISMFAAILWLHLGSGARTAVHPGLLLTSTAFALVGGLLLVKRPGHLVGATMLLGGTAWVLYDFARTYAVLSDSIIEGTVPGRYVAAWVGAWLGALLPISIAMLLLLFPNGRVWGRWRWLLWVLAVVTFSALIGAVLLWGLPVEVLLDFDRLDQRSEYLPVDTAFILGWLFIGPALVSLGWRYRRGQPVERQQIKWLLASSVAAVVGLALVFLEAVDQRYLDILLTVTLTLIPISILIAVLRYRLYEIDRIVNRTVVYAIVVGLLLGVYGGGVVLLQSMLPERSDLAVAASTLTAAALFSPLRTRVQRFVDRRFYRSRYNAQQIVEEFAARLRSELDPDGLIADWLSTVDRAVRPASASVWIRTPVPVNRGRAWRGPD